MNKTITRYEVIGWSKSAVEDSFEQGELPDTGTEFYGSDTWHGDTVDKIVEQLRRHVPFPTDKDAVELDACDDDGRIDISGMEDSEGNEPTEKQLAAWKQGKCKLWSCVYTFYVEQVARERVTLAAVKSLY